MRASSKPMFQAKSSFGKCRNLLLACLIIAPITAQADSLTITDQVVILGNSQAAAVAQSYMTNGYNRSVITQTGSGNQANSEQMNSGNAVSTTQTGNNNLSNVQQFGSGGTVLNTQTGNNLGISVTQTGLAPSIVITQTRAH